MPLIKIEDTIIPVISNVIEVEEPDETFTNAKINDNTILIRIGPIYFQTTKDTKPIGRPLFTVEPIELEFPISLFHKTKDNNHTLLRRVNLFFKGFCDILCPYSIPINGIIEVKFEQSKMKMGLGTQKMDKLWSFIPTKELLEDFEKELNGLTEKLRKDPHLFLSLMWLGHRLESKSDIQSFLDSYRIIENLSYRELELMLNDVNKFIRNNSKWNNYCKGKRPIELDLKQGNFVKNYLTSRWSVTEPQWDKINGIRNAIVHGESPDVEFRDDFREAFTMLDDLASDILINEIKPILKTNIILSRNEIPVTETNNGKFILKPLHECLKTNPESVADYKLEGLSKEKFERLISNSNLNHTEIEDLEITYKYRSHEILAKDVPVNISIENGFSMQNHDYGGVVTIQGSNS